MKFGQLQSEGGRLLRRFDNYPLITYVESGQHGLAHVHSNDEPPNEMAGRFSQKRQVGEKGRKSAKWAI